MVKVGKQLLVKLYALHKFLLSLLKLT